MICTKVSSPASCACRVQLTRSFSIVNRGPSTSLTVSACNLMRSTLSKCILVSETTRSGLCAVSACRSVDDSALSTCALPAGKRIRFSIIGAACNGCTPVHHTQNTHTRIHMHTISAIGSSSTLHVAVIAASIVLRMLSSQHQASSHQLRYRSNEVLHRMSLAPPPSSPDNSKQT